MNEELRKQIAEYHEVDRHQDIIDALERIPAAERDYETTGLLARAHNNIDDYAKAMELLESVRAEGQDDALWQFRMGYALYYLDRNAEALEYLNKAHELDPEDADTIFLIRRCNIEMPLAGRVERFWNWFVENENKLSEMIHPKSQEDADDYVEFVRGGASLISENMYYNIGGDYEFSFSVEGWPDLFILYPYIISRMPESLKPKWKFYPFNRGAKETFCFRMFDTDVDTARIMVRANYMEKTESFQLSYYEKNLNALPNNESVSAMWIILENTLGEGISFKYIDRIEPAADAEEDMIPLPELRKHIKETLEAHDRKFFENPKDIYSTYKLNPQEKDELRYDVIIGSTCLDSIIADYYNDSTEIFDHINSFGAQAVYIAFQNPEDIEGSDILNLRHDIEDRLTAEVLEPAGLGQVIGGAAGTGISYIDLIVFDLFAFLDAVIPLLEQYPTISFYLSDFRRHAGLSRLTEAVIDQPAADTEQN